MSIIPMNMNLGPQQHQQQIHSQKIKMMMPPKQLVQQQIQRGMQQFEEEDEDDDWCPPHLIKEHVLDHYEYLELVSKVENNIFDSMKLFRMHPFVKYIACKQMPIQQGIDYKERTSLRNPHVIFSLDYVKQNQDICLFFEYNFIPMKQLLQKRLDQQKFYPEAELLSMTKGLIYALRQLQNMNISHGSLDDNNIFFDLDYYIYRIYDNELINGRFSGYYKILKDPKYFTPLSPELLSTLGQNPNSHNPFKADVFSFGMVLLQICSLTPCEKFYNMQYKELNFEKINQILLQLGHIYSAELTNFIRACLELNPEKRPDWNVLAYKLNDPSLFDYSDFPKVTFSVKFQKSKNKKAKVQRENILQANPQIINHHNLSQSQMVTTGDKVHHQIITQKQQFY